MNKRGLIGSLVVASLFSTPLWSFGSIVDLGTFNVSPGENMNINVDETSIYSDVVYRVECTMQPSPQETTISISAYPSRKVSCSDYWYEDRDVCTVAPNTKSYAVFRNITKGTKYRLTIRSLDQANNLTFSCKAFPKLN